MVPAWARSDGAEGRLLTVEHLPAALGYAALFLAVIGSAAAGLYVLSPSEEEREERRRLPRWQRIAEVVLGVVLALAFIFVVTQVFGSR